MAFPKAAELRKMFAAGLGDAGVGNITIIKLVQGTYNVATGETSSESEVNYTGTAWLVRYTDRLIDGKSILATDRKLIFIPDNPAYVAEPSDIAVAAADERYKIIDAGAQKIGNEIVAYIMQVRNA